MRDTWNMTPDEARKYILQNWFDGDENVNSFVCGDEEYTAMAIAVEALEATKWYYPSRGELPDKDWSKHPLNVSKECFVFTKFGIGTIARWDNDCLMWFERPHLPVLEVIAWQYFEPPKEKV